MLSPGEVIRAAVSFEWREELLDLVLDRVLRLLMMCVIQDLNSRPQNYFQLNHFSDYKSATRQRRKTESQITV